MSHFVFVRKGNRPESAPGGAVDSFAPSIAFEVGGLERVMNHGPGHYDVFGVRMPPGGDLSPRIRPESPNRSG